MGFKPIPYRCFKDIDVYILQGFELNAVSGHTYLAQCHSIRRGEVGFIFKAHDIDGDSGGVGAHANLVKFPGPSIRIFDRVLSVPDIGIRNRFACTVLPVQEPELISRLNVLQLPEGRDFHHKT